MQLLGSLKSQSADGSNVQPGGALQIFSAYGPHFVPQG